MCFCYILYSPSSNKFYTGITQESVEERLVKHNTKAYGNHRFTAKVSDWELFLCIKAESISHARKMEVFIKRMKSQVFIRKLKDVPENLQFLINKTKNWATWLPRSFGAVGAWFDSKWAHLESPSEEILKGIFFYLAKVQRRKELNPWRPNFRGEEQRINSLAALRLSEQNNFLKYVFSQRPFAAGRLCGFAWTLAFFVFEKWNPFGKKPNWKMVQKVYF